jgi:RNA polymerase sigma-70 factor (ECF subfamily)
MNAGPVNDMARGYRPNNPIYSVPSVSLGFFRTPSLLSKGDIMKTRTSENNGLQHTSPDEETEILEIITQIKCGNKDAFGDLMDRYRRQVAALAYRIVGDYDDAADITQMVFVKVSQNISKFDEKMRFYTWLYRISVNASIDYLRKHRRHRHEQLDVACSMIGDDRENPENNIRSERLHVNIRNAVERLNDKQKTAFVLRDIEGCQILDVAGIMEMPEATVRWYLHRARTSIRKELIRKCPHLLRAIGII